MLNRKTEADLLWYFADGVRMLSRSSFGALLERAEALRFDSEGRKIPEPDRHSWNTMVVTHTYQAEPSYAPDVDALTRSADVSRRLRKLKREDAWVLEAHYGDIGARWSATKIGRLFAVYALTDAGQTYYDETARKNTERVRADEQINALMQLQKLHPDPKRKDLIQRMHQQATGLFSHACDAYEEVGHHA
jgi:hypothetical protein